MIVHLDSKCVVNNEDCARNLERALARNYPHCTKLPERTDKLAIVAAGPSVPDYLDDIKQFDHIWSVNGAYGYLIDQGIVPEGFVAVDPLPGLAAYFGKANKKTTFYISGFCDPAVFDVLEGFDVRLWFPDQTGIAQLDNVQMTAGGTTVVTRAPFVAHMLGYRDITLFGVDSSFREGRYCYPDGTYPEDSKDRILRVGCNGEGPFATELCLVKQVSQLGVMMMHPWGAKLNIKCDGLMAAYLRAPLEDGALAYAS